METASPAASSSGLTSFDPDDKRAKDLDSRLVDSESKRALLCAEVFVLMTITDSFRESPDMEARRFTASLLCGEGFMRGSPFTLLDFMASSGHSIYRNPLDKA
jgi:hypothetical protein